MLKNAYLGKLNGENLAISVSIKTFAAGLSGKLEAGDIVTLIASDVGEKKETLVLPELKYVEIIATTASSGADNDAQANARCPGIPRGQYTGREVFGGTAEGPGRTVCGEGSRTGGRDRGRIRDGEQSRRG